LSKNVVLCDRAIYFPTFALISCIGTYHTSNYNNTAMPNAACRLLGPEMSLRADLIHIFNAY